MSKSENPNSITNNIEINKIHLALFVEKLKNNSFNDSVDGLISRLQSELEKKNAEFLNFLEEGNNANQGYYLDTNFLEDRLLALSEMKVVYAYKNFEINIKQLIGGAYGVDTKIFYEWKEITTFLKSKEIEYIHLKGYQEILDLRNVNNSIKHSTHGIDNKIKYILEFSKINQMRHFELSEFLDRIKDFPNKFLDDLSSKISDNLY